METDDAKYEAMRRIPAKRITTPPIDVLLMVFEIQMDTIPLTAPQKEAIITKSPLSEELCRIIALATGTTEAFWQSLDHHYQLSRREKAA